MGIYDRDYVGEQGSFYDRGRGGGMPMGFTGMSRWSVNTWIIVLNVAVFLLDALLMPFIAYRVPIAGTPVTMGVLEAWGFFSTTTAIDHFQVWRFLTFQFLHAGPLHILFNMLALFWFGPPVEQHLGSRRYLAFYLLCGIAGAGMYLLLNLLGTMTGSRQLPFVLVNHPDVPLVGASAGVFGVLMGIAYLRPNQLITLLLMFIIPITLRVRTLAYALVGLALFALYTGSPNAGGEAGHLGGAILGSLLIRRPRWLNWALALPLERLKSKGRHPSRRWGGGSTWDVLDPGRNAPPRRKSGWFGGSAEPDEEEIDRILAKVATQGLQSLSASERRTLQRATESRRRG